MLTSAVQRDDPELEIALARSVGAKRVLTVASGGEVSLALKFALPQLEVHAFDEDPHQLVLCHHKQLAIQQGRLADLNVDNIDPEGLSQRGAFERLFRVLRAAFVELVAPALELEDFFVLPDPKTWAAWKASPFWPGCFAAAFAPPLLEAAFGPAFSRHADPASFAPYFQRVFERALGTPAGAKLPWIQGALLQRYLDPPAFLKAKRALPVQLHQATLAEVPELARFDVVSLSTQLDALDEAQVGAVASLLSALAPGRLVTWRQLNTRVDWTPLFTAFEVDAAASAEWTAKEGSLLFEKVTVLRRR